MSKEIMIDDVDVSQCKAFVLKDDAGYEKYCGILDLELQDDVSCKGCNCYYKRLKKTEKKVQDVQKKVNFAMNFKYDNNLCAKIMKEINEILNDKKV